MTEQQAMNWYYEDSRVNAIEAPPTWFDLSEKKREEIRSHVRKLSLNEVKPDDMSDTDLSIYFGRYQRYEKKPKGDFQRYTWWDSFELSKQNVVNSSIRLFSNINIGNAFLTNLQVAGMISTGMGVRLDAWHITTSDPLSSGLEFSDVENLLASAVVSFSIGDRPRSARHAHLLWHEPHPLYLEVPSKQHILGTIDFFGRTLEKIAEKMEKGTSFRVWVNLEGWREDNLL